MKIYIYKKKYTNGKRELVMKTENIKGVTIENNNYVVERTNGNHFIIPCDEFMVTIYGY